MKETYELKEENIIENKNQINRLLEAVEMNFKIIDFETSTTSYSLTETHVYLWCIFDENENNYLIGYDIDSFMQQCFKYKNDTTFYAHNLTFDGDFIVNWLLDNGYKDVSTKLKEESKENFGKRNKVLKNNEKNFDIFQDENNRIYYIKIKNKDSCLLTFLCSYNILNVSIKNLTKELQFEEKKGKIDYDKYHKDNIALVKKDKLLHDYIKMDCYIVMKAIRKLYNQVTKDGMKNKLFGITSSSISLKSFIDFVNNYKFNIDHWVVNQYKSYKKAKIPSTTFYNILFDGKMNGIDHETHTLLRTKFYRGGYCGGKFSDANKWIKCVNGQSYDVNSLYPYVMLKKSIPCGPMLNKKPNFESLEYVIVYITKIRPKQKDYIPLIKNTLIYDERVVNGKTLYLKYYDMIEDGGFEMGFLKEELDFILKYYNIKYKVVKRFWFRSTSIMNDYIEIVKRYKLEAKTPIQRKIAKLRQNSLYGKFGQSLDKGRIIYKKRTEEDFVTKATLIYGNDTIRQIYVGGEGTQVYRNPLVSSTITAWARLELWKAIFDNYDKFLYCDTDSLWLLDKPNKLIIDEKEYGKWKLEHQYKEFKWIRPKCYAYIDLNNKFECVVSGLTKQTKEKHINKENFNIGLVLEDSKKQMRRVKGGILLKEIKFTIKDTFYNNIQFVINKWEK